MMTTDTELRDLIAANHAAVTQQIAVGFAQIDTKFAQVDTKLAHVDTKISDLRGEGRSQDSEAADRVLGFC
jgi:hypothetical protein